MDDDLYDEFGNYIGPELADSDDEEQEIGEQQQEQQHENNRQRAPSSPLITPMDTSAAAAENHTGMTLVGDDDTQADLDDITSSSIVLHEDKQNYPDASDVYPGAQIMVQDEDTQALEEPIIAPIKTKTFTASKQTNPDLKHDPEFIGSLLENPSLARNVALVGHLHHGKTTLADLMVEQTHAEPWDPNEQPRHCDTRTDEQARELSIKSAPTCLALPSSSGKHFAINLIDCPGHVNFGDEATAGLRVSDGALLVVDAVEGVLMNTKKMIRQSLEAGVVICLCVAKVDRLIHELKLPPADSYFKLLHTIESVNTEIQKQWREMGGKPREAQPEDDDDDQQGGAKGIAAPQRLSPELGNVCFAAAANGWSFTLNSFARLYVDWFGMQGMEPSKLARRLWGDVYYDDTTRKFRNRPRAQGVQRTFVHFVLEPLYKIYSQVLGEEPAVLKETVKQLGIKVSPTELHMDAKPLLKVVLSRFFGGTEGIVDMLVEHVPNPRKAAAAKVGLTYTGDKDTVLYRAISECDVDGPLVIQIVKLYSRPEDANSFDAFGRVLSGMLVRGQDVRVLGEAYTLEDDEDQAVCSVGHLAVPQGRHRLNINRAVAGNLVLIEGLDAHINKTATVVDCSNDDAAAAEVFLPLKFNSTAVIKLAVEPLNPSELPKMLAGLRGLNKTYPMMQTKVEESGEHVVFGTGELYMDCMMHDLRETFSDVEVKISDPVVSFCETVIETSSLKCYAQTANKQNKLTMIAEPLEKGLAEDIESGAVSLDWEKKKVQDFFMGKYDWDLLAARSIWAFAPDDGGPNVLLDDTLPSEVDKKLLGTVRESIVQGFRWGSREGPLCDEPVRNVKLKILDATIASEPLHRGAGQVIPTARRVAYSSMLLASPRLLEPVFFVEVQAPADMVTPVYNVLARRRGHVVKDSPIPGSPFYLVHGFIPVIDSFGFETDLRCHTQGLAFVLQDFDHWSVVPGDPLDSSIVLRPLEPSPTPHLAREFMVKTRRRKGLSEDVSVDKYFDDPDLLAMVKQDMAMHRSGGMM